MLYSPRPDSSGWLSLCVHGMSSVHTNVPRRLWFALEEWEEEQSNWTDIAKYCPKTVEWMRETVRYKKYTRLDIWQYCPDGWIMPHVDTDKIPCRCYPMLQINNPKDVN